MARKKPKIVPWNLADGSMGSIEDAEALATNWNTMDMSLGPNSVRSTYEERTPYNLGYTEGCEGLEYFPIEEADNARHDHLLGYKDGLGDKHPELLAEFEELQAGHTQQAMIDTMIKFAQENPDEMKKILGL